MAYKILHKQQFSAMSRLFSSALIKELAKQGKSSLFVRLAKESSVLDLTEPDDLVRNFFDAAFSLMKRKDYRHEYIYKAALAHKILLGTHSLQTAVMLNEFRVCNSKADIVVFNGTSTVYEIKSERDSLTRLEQQINSYRKVFAKVNVITGEKHLNSVLAKVPKDVGVLVLSNRYQISTIREGLDFPEKVSSAAIYEAIQVSEAKKILNMYGIFTPSLPNTQIYGALRDQFLKLEPIEAHNGMIKVLRSTRSLIHLTQLLENTPESLQSLVLSTRIRKNDHKTLIEALNTPMKNALNWF